MYICNEWRPTNYTLAVGTLTDCTQRLQAGEPLVGSPGALVHSQLATPYSYPTPIL